MSQITLEDVKRLAKLSRIAIDDEQAEKLLPELASILEYVKKLDAVDTEGLDPTSQVTGLQNVTREDVVKNGLIGRDALLNVAPEQDGESVIVKRVL